VENETVLDILKLILAGSPLSEVLTILRAAMAPCAPSGSLTKMGQSSRVRPRPAFPASLPAQEQCLSVHKVDLAAQLFIAGNRCM